MIRHHFNAHPPQQVASAGGSAAAAATAILGPASSSRPNVQAPSTTNGLHTQQIGSETLVWDSGTAPYSRRFQHLPLLRRLSSNERPAPPCAHNTKTRSISPSKFDTC